MLISEETKIQLNKLLQKSFESNAIADNIAYNLADVCYPNISDIYHHSFAHAFPGDKFADGISGLMDLLDARSTREGLESHTEDFGGDLIKMFETNLSMCDDYRREIIKSIELAEYNGDFEVKIKLEEMLLVFLPYRKQAYVWYEYAKRYQNDWKTFDVHFEDYTTYIDIIK